MRIALATVLTMSCLPAIVVGPVAAQGASESTTSTRADFLRTIARPNAPLEPSPGKLTVENGYSQELLSFVSEPGERVPLLIVKKGQRRDRQAVIIALHGTNGSKEDMRARLETYADLGFLGVAMDARHHGERARPIDGLPNSYQSAMLRAYRTGEGHPYLYETVWDVIRLLEYPSTRTDVDPARIGLIDQSKGGTEAYLAAGGGRFRRDRQRPLCEKVLRSHCSRPRREI
jgi:cephalosporin-C deacetylase-like acetyl esterase